MSQPTTTPPLCVPVRVPEPGYYYHHKHDPRLSVNNYAYHVLGVAHDTESDCPERFRIEVIYRPLYASFVYWNGKMFDKRPLEMFFRPAVIPEVSPFPRSRFVKIENQRILDALFDIERAMYSVFF